MTPTTLIFAYYLNKGMLQFQYEHIRSLPDKVRDLLHVIVVDDGSPQDAAWIEDLGGVPLQVYRIDVDVRWNQDAARNIGVHHAETSWLFLTDIDHVVPKKTWESLLFKDWDKRRVYSFARVSAPAMDPYHHHPNTWFMHRKLYGAIGGYDERFAGYYGSDSDFRRRVAKVADTKPLKETIIRYPRTVIPDASTTTFLRKQPEDRAGIMRINAEIAAIPKVRNRQGGLSFPYHRVCT